MLAVVEKNVIGTIMNSRITPSGINRAKQSGKTKDKRVTDAAGMTTFDKNSRGGNPNRRFENSTFIQIIKV